MGGGRGRGWRAAVGVVCGGSGSGRWRVRAWRQVRALCAAACRAVARARDGLQLVRLGHNTSAVHGMAADAAAHQQQQRGALPASACTTATPATPAHARPPARPSPGAAPPRHCQMGRAPPGHSAMPGWPGPASAGIWPPLTRGAGHCQHRQWQPTSHPHAAAAAVCCAKLGKAARVHAACGCAPRPPRAGSAPRHASQQRHGAAVEAQEEGNEAPGRETNMSVRTHSQSSIPPGPMAARPVSTPMAGNG